MTHNSHVKHCPLGELCGIKHWVAVIKRNPRAKVEMRDIDCWPHTGSVPLDGHGGLGDVDLQPNIYMYDSIHILYILYLTSVQYNVTHMMMTYSLVIPRWNCSIVKCKEALWIVDQLRKWF